MQGESEQPLLRDGLTIALREDTSGGSALSSQSDQAVFVLQGAIERGELRPASMVSEQALMELTGLGRTPVREAIQRLALTHMLRVHPNRGIEIPSASVEDQLSRLEVRRSLEILAVRLACERATSTDHADMDMLQKALTNDFSLQDYSETVRKTHLLIIKAAQDPYLETLMTPLQSLSRRFWIMHVKDVTKEVSIGRTLHGGILRAICLREVAAAERASQALNDYLVQFALDTLARRPT